jgi:hypothetical protein
MWRAKQPTRALTKRCHLLTSGGAHNRIFDRVDIDVAVRQRMKHIVGGNRCCTTLLVTYYR